MFFWNLCFCKNTNSENVPGEKIPGNAPDPLVNITSYTGGEVFAAGDPEGLKAVFRNIDAMQKSRLEKTSAETMDHFHPYCLAGISLLGIFTIFGFGLRYTPW